MGPSCFLIGGRTSPAPLLSRGGTMVFFAKSILLLLGMACADPGNTELKDTQTSSAVENQALPRQLKFRGMASAVDTGNTSAVEFQAVSLPRKLQVSCGGHTADECAKCADFAGWCNGDCEWEESVGCVACGIKKNHWGSPWAVHYGVLGSCKCEQMCNEKAICRAWTYVGNTNACFLREKLREGFTEVHWQHGMVSGEKPVAEPIQELPLCRVKYSDCQECQKDNQIGVSCLGGCPYCTPHPLHHP